MNAVYFCDKPDHGWTGFFPCPFCRADVLEREKAKAAEMALDLAKRLADIECFSDVLVRSPDEGMRDIGQRLREVTRRRRSSLDIESHCEPGDGRYD